MTAPLTGAAQHASASPNAHADADRIGAHSGSDPHGCATALATRLRFLLDSVTVRGERGQSIKGGSKSMALWKDGPEMRVTRRAARAALCLLLSACGSKLDLGGQVGTDGGSSGEDALSGTGQCTFDVTISNLAFYGTGTQGTSICDGLMPPVDTIMNAPYARGPATGVISYGSSYLWSTYTKPSSGTPTTTLENAGALRIAGQVSNSDPTNPEHLALAGIGFNSTQCVNASAFGGVRFDVAGDLGGCRVLFEVDSSEDTSSNDAPADGRCDADPSNCTSPSYVLTQTGTTQSPFTTQLLFTAFDDGSPQAAVDTASILSVQWVFMPP